MIRYDMTVFKDDYDDYGVSADIDSKGKWVRFEDCIELEGEHVRVCARLLVLEKALREINDPTILAQLRHAYKQVRNNLVTNQAEFAKGLLGPQIDKIERAQDIARVALEGEK